MYQHLYVSEIVAKTDHDHRLVQAEHQRRLAQLAPCGGARAFIRRAISALTDHAGARRAAGPGGCRGGGGSATPARA